MSRVTTDDIAAIIHRNRLIEAAQRFAAAEKSDPFAFARAVTHIRNGLCRSTQNGQAGHYDAEPYTETRRLPDGQEYQATVYRNLVRP